MRRAASWPPDEDCAADRPHRNFSLVTFHLSLRPQAAAVRPLRGRENGSLGELAPPVGSKRKKEEVRRKKCGGRPHGRQMRTARPTGRTATFHLSLFTCHCGRRPRRCARCAGGKTARSESSPHHGAGGEWKGRGAAGSRTSGSGAGVVQRVGWRGRLGGAAGGAGGFPMGGEKGGIFQ